MRDHEKPVFDSIPHQDSSVGKSLDLQSKDCRFEPHCRQGVILVWQASHSKLLVRVQITMLKRLRSQPVD